MILVGVLVGFVAGAALGWRWRRTHLAAIAAQQELAEGKARRVARTFGVSDDVMNRETLDVLRSWEHGGGP